MKLFPYVAFNSKLRGCNPPEVENEDKVNRLKLRISTKQAVIKLKLTNLSITGLRTNKICSKFECRNRWINQRCFVLMNEWSFSSKLRGNANNHDYFYHQRYRYVKTQLYISNRSPTFLILKSTDAKLNRFRGREK